MAKNPVRHRSGRKLPKKKTNQRRRQVIPIDVLPNEILLAIFDFCAYDDSDTKQGIEAWQSLVHVCRRWRSVVFGSPRRLNLRLVGTPATPVRDTLDVWPALPLLVEDYGCADGCQTEGLDNTIAMLEHRNRVFQIDLTVDPSSMKMILAAMQEPFLELTNLALTSTVNAMSALPVSFLGGSAPRLRQLTMEGIPFPGLPRLLLSATHLVRLYLHDIPHSGYISPEAVLIVLSTLTSLDALSLEFRFPGSRGAPDHASRRPIPLTRTVVPALTMLSFQGTNEYLDNLVAHIDAPQLDTLYITFFHQIVLDPLQLIRFISRTPLAVLGAPDSASVFFTDWFTSLELGSSGSMVLEVNIECRELNQQILSLAQICVSSFPILSTCEHLSIVESRTSQPEWQDIIESMPWLELLRPYTAVKNLHLSEKIAQCIVPALQELVGSRTTEVLPTLENISLEKLQLSGPVQEGLGQFVAAREVTGHPIAVSVSGKYQALDTESG